MSVIKSQLNTKNADFQSNAAAMRKLVADLQEKLEEVKLGGGDDARFKHLKRDKMLPRDRIKALLASAETLRKLRRFIRLTVICALPCRRSCRRLYRHFCPRYRTMPQYESHPGF